jgi:hypothetical protein
MDAQFTTTCNIIIIIIIINAFSQGLKTWLPARV